MVFFENNPEMDYFITFMDNPGLLTKTSALLTPELKCYIKMIYQVAQPTAPISPHIINVTHFQNTKMLKFPIHFHKQYKTFFDL